MMVTRDVLFQNAWEAFHVSNWDLVGLGFDFYLENRMQGSASFTLASKWTCREDSPMEKNCTLCRPAAEVLLD